MKSRTKHLVAKLSEPKRIADYAVGVFPLAPTKTALKKAIKENRLRLNSQVAKTADYVQGGEELELIEKEPKPEKRALIFPLKVIYEDETLAAIFKPAGIAVSGNSFKTIANALVQNLKPSKNPDAVIPKPVHRLDYATTGVLLIGKTQSSITALNNLFKNKEIQKTYLAVCIGDLPDLKYIDFPIDGKQACSKIEFINRIESEKYGYLNLLKLFPETGRKHQLRKHLSEIGHPILGDQVYGKEGLILKGKGLYLHAMSLEFTHPNSNQLIKIKAEPPNRFNKLFPSY